MVHVRSFFFLWMVGVFRETRAAAPNAAPARSVAPDSRERRVAAHSRVAASTGSAPAQTARDSIARLYLNSQAPYDLRAVALYLHERTWCAAEQEDRRRSACKHTS